MGVGGGLVGSAGVKDTIITGVSGSYVHDPLVAGDEGWVADLTAYTYDGATSAGDSTPRDVILSQDGNYMYTVGSSLDRIVGYTLTTPFEAIGGKTSNGAVAAGDALPEGVGISDDGTRLFCLYETIREYSLSTPYIVSSASVVTNHSLPTTAAHGMSFSQDGLNLILGATAAYWCTLSTPFDLTTLTYTGKAFSMTAQDSDPNGIAISSDGLKMYMIGATTNNVFEYELTVPYDVSTATYTGVSFSGGSYDSSMKGICFNNTGSKMYLVGSANDNVYQFSL